VHFNHQPEYLVHVEHNLPVDKGRMVMPIEMPPDEAFRFIFGVSRQELQDQGVDIQRYVKKHLHKAMRRKEVLDTIVPLPP